MKDKIGIIVDGQGDYASLNAKFKGFLKIIKTDGPRGHCATKEQIVSKSKKQIAILKGFGCTKVISLIDFECRNESVQKFLSSINAKFKEQFDIEISACLANRMIENWYLADIVHLSKEKKYLVSQKKQKNYEGMNGKAEIKKMMAKGVKYNEIKHGGQMFQALRLDSARRNSNSLDMFLRMCDQ